MMIQIKRIMHSLGHCPFATSQRIAQPTLSLLICPVPFAAHGALNVFYYCDTLVI